MKISESILKGLWWVIIIIYSYAYVFYMPIETFGTSQFSALLWGINFLPGLYVLLKLGGLLNDTS